jgi:hypothetical protein
MKDYVPLLAASVSAVTLIAVALLGAWIGRRNEHAKWQREQRLETYAAWLAVEQSIVLFMERSKNLTEKYAALVQESSVLPPEALERVQQCQETADKLAAEQDEHEKVFHALRLEEYVAANRLQILASKPVRVQAERVHKAMNRLVSTEKAAQATPSSPWVDAVAEFHIVVRKELGLR